MLGPVRLCRDGEERSLGGLQRELLVALLLRANVTVPAATLAEAVWGPRKPDRAVSNLYVHVHRLRKLLDEPGRLTAQPGGYRLAVAPDELDMYRFESLLVEAEAAEPARAVELIRAALRLWRGEPFEGIDAAWCTVESHRLGQRRGGAVEALYAAELDRGRHAAVVDELTEQALQYPFHERLHGLLMTALYRCGRQGRALAVYRAMRGRLIDELGQEPGPELRSVERHILAGEPLDLTTVPAEVKPPAQLPRDVPDFTGRRAELSALDALEDGAVVTVTGSGGVGKTALAVHWSHRVRARFPDGQLCADLCGYGPAPAAAPDEVLAGFLRQLGLSGAEVPGDHVERITRFRTLTAGKRLLLLLDNADTAEQVRPLLPGGVDDNGVGHQPRRARWARRP